jgi:hypothetical protein
MRKSTKRVKKNKYNKTFKKTGGGVNTLDSSMPQQVYNKQPYDINNKNDINNNNNNNEPKGVFDYLGDKIKSGVNNVATIATDAGLKAFGLERIDKSEQESNVNDKINEVGDVASSLVSNISKNIENVANKTSAAVVENVNEVLGSDTVKENIQQAAQNTATILKDNAEIFNTAMNDPVVKEELVEAIDNAAEIGNVVIEAAKEPINKAADVIAEAAPKAIAAASSGAVKVITDIAAAAPGIGGVIDMMKAFNDGSRAVSGVVEATADAVEAGSELITETKENFEKGMEILEKNKKMAQEISNRTSQSINDFENPYEGFNNNQSGGLVGRKTRRKLTKRRAKSKRVRFAF